ncbi:dehydrogenase/reductase SDR family member on chromosome X [Acomys russatus]|uniref:dehydrogenase/reductase SDR family member on chromosome X n=1 Tax=Acomys russatus TaxID=60746 RepID=UPI0021E297EA|nr:dehydrogenase/reductase SDR family member on chromosome X [Acomys russatus]
MSLHALRATVRVYAVGVALVVTQLLRRLRRGFAPPELPPQPGRVAIVTGGTDGIGLSTARQLARLGMRVVIASNNLEKAPEVVRSIQEETGNDAVQFLFLDLASLASVRKFVSDFLALGIPLHVLINNAGIMLVPCGETLDGFESHLGVNFLGHFLLTRLLLPLLRGAGKSGKWARIVTVASATHYVGELDVEDLQGRSAYSPHAAYAQSKLALVMFSLRLQWLLNSRCDPVTSNLADPGVVDTALYRHAWWGLRAAQGVLGWLLLKTPDEGAWTSVYAAASPELEGIGGCYFRDLEWTEPLGAAKDQKLQRWLWAESCRLTGDPEAEDGWDDGSLDDVTSFPVLRAFPVSSSEGPPRDGGGVWRGRK